MRKHLGQPLTLLREIAWEPFARGLPKLEILRNVAVANIFKSAIACDGISSSGLGNDKLKEALEMMAPRREVGRWDMF